MTKRLVGCAVLLLAASTAACAPQGGGASSGAEPQRPVASSQALAIVIYAEPGTLAQKALGAGPGTSFTTTVRAFNATLGIIDGDGIAHPYLAEALPDLHTDSWRVFPDGRMETTWRLRPNLTWHDGAPLTSDDFVFAWEVYSSPGVGIAGRSPQNLIAGVTASNPQTVHVNWARPFPAAGHLAGDNFPPLPRHLLQTAFQEDPAGLQKEPAMTREYVGAGPFRLSRWELGAFIDGVAFEAHVLGRPRIERLRINFMNDANAAVAAVLAGDVQVATDIALKFEQGLILQRGWVVEKKGRVITRNGSYHAAWFQLRPEFASPRAQLDSRVRKALAYSVNKQDILDAVFEGHGTMSEVPCIPPTSSYYPEAERAVVRYPYDPRISEQLMAEAGFRKGPDGVFLGATEGPLKFELKTLVSAERQKAQAVLTANWRQAGFDFAETLLPPAQAVDSQLRATFPGIFNFTQTPGEYALAHDYSSAGIGRPENRWFGNNRGGWSNEEFDRLSAAFADAVSPADRTRYIAQMARVMTENVPGIPLYFELGTEAFSANLHGPNPVAQESVIPWNIHEWTLL